MSNEEYSAALYEKMFAEQEKYRDWLKSQPPEEILRHAYEYTVREDILVSLEYRDLTDEQTKALLTSPAPLGDIFRSFEKIETGHMDIVWDCIETHANNILEDQKRVLKETPVYPYPASHARESGELEQYQASTKANIACKEAIEDAIREHYHNNRLDKEAAAQVIDTFGLDRTLYVLANTVQEKDWDGRFSTHNKEWASTVPIHPDPDGWGNDRNRQFVVNSHSGLTDCFITAVRQEHCQRQEKSGRPSVREKLKSTPKNNSPKISAKFHGQEH